MSCLYPDIELSVNVGYYEWPSARYSQLFGKTLLTCGNCLHTF